MTVRRFEVTAVVDAAGAYTGYTPYFSGYIQTIEYIKTDYANGVGFTLTAEATGESIWAEAAVNAAAVRAPRMPTHSQAGVAALYAAGGTAVNDRIALGRDRVKIVIASGGVSKTGKFVFLDADEA